MSTYLSPVGNGAQYFDNQGLPLNAGKLYSYLSGTTTPAATFSDLAGIVPNTNPIILNSAGRPAVEIRFAKDVVYTLELRDADDAVLWTLNDLAGVNDIAGNGPDITVPLWVTFGVTPVRVSDTSFYLTGNWSAILNPERRVELVQSGGSIYGSVVSCNVTEVTPGDFISTVVLRLDSGIILSDVSSGFYSIIDPQANPVPTDEALVLRVDALEASVALLEAQVAAALVTVNNAIPVGSSIWWPAGTPPAGWAEENGAAISRTTYSALFGVIGTLYGVGDGSTTFNLPDSRGYFMRAWDHGRGVDAGRAIATIQGDQLPSHSHMLPMHAGLPQAWGSHETSFVLGADGYQYTYPIGGTSNGSECRPKNLSMMKIIRLTA